MSNRNAYLARKESLAQARLNRELRTHTQIAADAAAIAERCGFCDSAAGMARPNADDYCSHGVRKEPEREDNNG